MMSVIKPCYGHWMAFQINAILCIFTSSFIYIFTVINETGFKQVVLFVSTCCTFWCSCMFSAITKSRLLWLLDGKHAINTVYRSFSHASTENSILCALNRHWYSQNAPYFWPKLKLFQPNPKNYFCPIISGCLRGGQNCNSHCARVRRRWDANLGIW